MPSHITIPELQDLQEQFMKENPTGDSLELAEFMFNAGYEAGEQGGLGEANFRDPDSDPDGVETYYQPNGYYDDGTNIDSGDVPEGLFSHQVFRTWQDCKQWLLDHGYDPGEWNIVEYHGDDIEDHEYIEP